MYVTGNWKERYFVPRKGEGKTPSLLSHLCEREGGWIYPHWSSCLFFLNGFPRGRRRVTRSRLRSADEEYWPKSTNTNHNEYAQLASSLTYLLKLAPPPTRPLNFFNPDASLPPKFLGAISTILINFLNKNNTKFSSEVSSTRFTPITAVLCPPTPQK